MSRLVLAVLHQRDSTPGKVGAFLRERGYALDRRCPCLGDPLPEDLSRYAAAVVFGGPHSAMHCYVPGIRSELEWLEAAAMPSGVPLLGICLGAQQIARVLGARVGPHPAGWVEIGYHPVEPTAEGAGFLDGALRFYQWHSETFEIPRGAVHLARNEVFPSQAFRYGESVWGIEFHPEMTREMVAAWSDHDGAPERLARPGAQDRDTQLRGYDGHADASDRWLAGFLDRCLLPDPAIATVATVATTAAAATAAPVATGRPRARASA